MWTRCWWATWLSGFFVIFGLLHLARLVVRVPIRVGTYDVPLTVTLVMGLGCLVLSAALLWVEVQRERAKRSHHP